MDWNHIRQHLTSWPVRLRQGWLELTDDDVDIARGRRDALAGHPHDRYGLHDDDGLSSRDQDRPSALGSAAPAPHLRR
jgi:hypothetical protein